MGKQKAQLLIDHVTRECFDKTTFFATVLSHCTRLYGSITRGISEIMQKVNTADGSTSITKILPILSKLQTLAKISSTINEIRNIMKSAESFLEKANHIIQDEIAEYKSSGVHVVVPENVQSLCDQTMNQWKKTVIETSNQAIARYVFTPILSYGANQLVGFMGDMIKRKYRSYKEETNRKEFEKLKKGFDANIKQTKLDAEEYEKQVKTYHEKLIKLLSKTRDPKLFATILRENVPMDMTCVQACTNMLDPCMRALNIIDGKIKFTGISVVIEGSDGSSHEYSSSENPSHRIFLTLDDKHFRVNGYENTENSKNNCLYEALLCQIPELKMVFSNGNAFRQYLSNHIENDDNLRYTIAQGWHKFGIEKGSYGGAIREEKYDPTTLYNKHLSNVKRIISDIYNNNPNLSEENRKEINDCVNNIDNIASGDLQSGNAANDIDTAVDRFNKYLRHNMPDVELKLKTELKQAISTFRERIIQTVRQNYLETLEEFKTQAIHADQHPNNPISTHVGDRVDFTRDDIDLQTLQNNPTKLRNDPNIIASIIHAKLNQNVPENERRFNTVLVGIHKEAVYIALNQIGIENGVETYGITDTQCEEICQYLTSKKLLQGRYKVVFLKEKNNPTDRIACRAPHGEMQIMRFWKNSGILEADNTKKNKKPCSIGGSKPPCLCCSAAMKTRNVAHQVYGKANTSPTNWIPFADINVEIQMVWKVQNQPH